MILYAPSGLAGLIVMHRRLVALARVAGVLAAYAIALVPLALMAAGAVLLIEMSYRLSTQPELGTQMRDSVDAARCRSAWPWIVAAVAARRRASCLFRATWPLGLGSVGAARAARRATRAMTSASALAAARCARSASARPDHSRRFARHRRGERHAIIGPNGAGKSTLFNLISGRFAPTRGSIRLNGEEIAGRHAVRDQPTRPRAQLPGHQHLSAPVGIREPPLQRAVVARLSVLLLAQRRHAARRR